MPSGGVPDGAPADWLNWGLSPFFVWSDDPDAELLAGCSAWAVFVICACAFDDAGLPLDWAEVLPESCVQPVTRIPAMRIADAISIMILLFFIRFISRSITTVSVPATHLNNRLLQVGSGFGPWPGKSSNQCC